MNRTHQLTSRRGSHCRKCEAIGWIVSMLDAFDEETLCRLARRIEIEQHHPPSHPRLRISRER